MRAKLFGHIAQIVCRRPAAVLFLAVGLSAAGVGLASTLQMHTSRIDLLSSDSVEVRNYTRFTREFGTANNIYFIIEGPTLKISKRCADFLAAEISGHPAYIRDVLYKFDMELVERNIFLYLSPEQLRALGEYLDEEADLLKEIAGAEGLNALLATVEKLADKRAMQGFKHPATSFELAALAGLLESVNSYLWEDGVVELLPSVVSGSLPLGGMDDPEGYLVGRNGRAVILLARPNSEKEDSIDFLRPMMESLLEAREKALRRFPGTSIGMTGLPTFAYGDLRVMENEIPILSLAALAAVGVLFLLFFRHPLEILFAGVTMLAAFACTLGATRLLIGHLNIISSVFGLMMAGLGIDFGVHFIARYNEERQKKESIDSAVRAALAGCGPPISTGAVTTAAAFFMLATADFKGLAELGVVAGTGILLCLVCMVTVLPAMVSMADRRRRPGERNGRAKSPLAGALGFAAAAADKNAGAILAAGAFTTLLMCYFAPRVSFDYNFLHIQPITSTTARNEEILMARTGLSPSFNVIVEEDLNSLKQAAARLEALPSVSRVDSAVQLVPANPGQKVEFVGPVIEKIADIGGRAGGNPRPVDVDRLVGQYTGMRRGLGTAIRARALLGDERTTAQIRRSARALDRFFEKYRDDDPGRVSRRLQDFSRDLFSYLEKQLAALGGRHQLETLELADFPDNVRTRFVGKSGKYAAYVFPSRSVWDKTFLDRFNADVLAVAPGAAGTTMFAQALLDSAGRALRQCSLLVFAAIVLLLFLDFRRPVPALLALLSVVVGVIWMLGIMRLAGWQYNPINITAVPLTLGIGIDNGVHIVHRFRESGGDIRAALITSGRAVTVSSLTTIAGFACLLFSTHRGLISLGQLMVLGVGCCLVASLTVLPATLKTLSAAGIKV